MRYVVETQPKGDWGSIGWRQTGYWESPQVDEGVNDPANVTDIEGTLLCSPKIALARAWEELGLDVTKMLPSEYGESVPDCTYTHGYRFASKTDLGTDEIRLYAEECDCSVTLVPIGSRLGSGAMLLTTLPHEEFPLYTDWPTIENPDAKVQGQNVGIAFRWIIAKRGMTFTQFMGRSHMLKYVRGILYGTSSEQARNRRFTYIEHMAEFLGYWVVLRLSRVRVVGEIEVNLSTPDVLEQNWFEERDDRSLAHYPQVYEHFDLTRFVFRAPTRLEEAVEALEQYGLGLYVGPLRDDESLLRVLPSEEDPS